ncbi:hybrid sensor histidine kinase/response regulator [Pedobacter psychrophilus]|uniref:histidine kinase n=1 Tax=Pedobacter psychrophilus TaxID=1826909 RepID=A0A179DBH2_9SPHI|nr:hybrid sensor histidine kinase/response regulator [Pedobacter psychrophilus]
MIRYLIKIVCVSAILICFLSCLKAQEIKIAFDKLTVEAGLSQSSVLSITQDKKGFMWFGTKDGLNRYDSQQFEVFRHHENDPNSLSSSQSIGALLTDRKGNLWVGTQDGLNKYQPETKSFVRYINNPKNKKSLSNNTIRSIYEDRQGNIWIGTEDGLNKLNNDGSFERYFCNNSLGAGVVNAAINSIYQDSKYTLWVGTKNGLVNINFKKQGAKFSTYFHDPNNSQTPISNDITSIVEDFNHNIWLGHHFSGLDFFDRVNNNFKHINGNELDNKFGSNNIRKILVAKDGLLWIATLNGIRIYDPVKNRFDNNIHDPENPGSLNQNSIYNLYQDKAGSIWVGTYFGGINVYHPNAIPFTTYKHNSYKNSLSSNIISAIVEDKNHNLWIGTEAEGLNFYNRQTGQFTNIKSSKNSISSNLIKSMAIDQNQNLWIATYNGGIDFYDLKTKVFKNYILNKDSYQEANRIIYLTIDDKNRVWVGTRGNGLFLYSSASNRFIALQNSKSQFKFSEGNISYLFQDKSKTLWVATDNGLYYLKDGSVSFKSLVSSNTSFLKHINCINQTEDGKVWIGSYDEGIASFTFKNNALKFYTVNNGLPSDNIASIVEDNNQNLWISTDKGLARMNDDKFNVYNINDGLPGNIFNYHSFLLDSKGELFFGGYNGLVSFHPEDIIENKIAPQIVFTHLRVFNKEVNINDDSKILKKSIDESDELIFSYQQDLFSISFSALNFVKSKKNKYAYKLKGYEEEWNYVDNPTAVFNNVPSGSYNLLVKASNNDGVWSENDASLKIVIRPPFWRTWWAYLIYFAILAGGLYFVLRFIFIRALLKREHDVNQMKLDFFTNVSHEIRTPLTLILGPLEKMLHDTEDNLIFNEQLLIINKNAKRLMKLVNELMDFRKIESGNMKLNLSENNIVSFVNEIFLSFEELAKQKNIDYTFKAHQDIIKVYYDKEQLEKVIFNLLSNAFKFTAKINSRVHLDLKQTDQYVYLRITDNGMGIPEENKKNLFTNFYQVPNHQQRNVGTGIGLALSKNIAKLHHGNLVLEQSDVNTTFCLSLMIGNSQYKPHEINIIENNDYDFQLDTIDNDFFLDELKIKNAGRSILPLILVVDDNLEIKEFIISTLIPFYQIVAASNGKEALELAFEKIPDVIISDVMMPEMDGFELCTELKQDIRTRHIPIVLLTAKSSELNELEGLKTGADVYLTKPFSTTKLKLIVENLISLHQNMREKFSQQFTLQPTDFQIVSSDGEFLNKVLKLLEANIDNIDFNVNLFASEIGMSTPVFYKKIFALTGLTVNNFIKSIRLKRALQLLQQKAGNISEIAYMVGFNDAKYFSKEFKKQYGKLPSSYN